MPEEVEKGTLLQDLKTAAETLGKVPSRSEYDDVGEYSPRVFDYKFGGFSTAREVAGLNDGPQRPEKIPRQELLECIRAVGNGVDGSPTESQVIERGDYALDTYVRRFGSWASAVSEAGFEPNQNVPEGEENPAYVDGNSHNYSSKAWRLARERALQRDDEKCLVCGMSNEEHKELHGRAIDVHHITRVGNYENAEEAHYLDNLVTLCRAHHREYEHLPNERAKELLG